MSGPDIRYSRSRFFARLPTDRLYTKGHFWLARQEERPNVWRVGLTRFAIRMLGELVEHDFEVKAGDAVSVGQVIGWLEGFKAASDLYCVGNGRFVAGNVDLQRDISLVQSDPHHAGWLYTFEGDPDSEAVDVEGYMAVLDTHIDKLLGEHDAGLLDEDRDASSDC